MCVPCALCVRHRIEDVTGEGRQLQAPSQGLAAVHSNSKRASSTHLGPKLLPNFRLIFLPCTHSTSMGTRTHAIAPRRSSPHAGCMYLNMALPWALGWPAGMSFPS